MPRGAVNWFKKQLFCVYGTSLTMSSRKKPADCHTITSYFAKRSRLGIIMIEYKTASYSHLYAIDTTSSSTHAETVSPSQSSPSSSDQCTASSSGINKYNTIMSK